MPTTERDEFDREPEVIELALDPIDPATIDARFKEKIRLDILQRRRDLRLPTEPPPPEQA
jgi:hypothetical protein